MHGWLSEHMILTSFMNSVETFLLLAPNELSCLTAHLGEPRYVHWYTDP